MRDGPSRSPRSGDEDDDELPSLEDMLWGAKRKRTLSSTFSSQLQVPDDRLDDVQSRNPNPCSSPPSKRRRHRPPAAMPASVPTKREVIDLTDTSEQCAICPHALGEGQDRSARIYMFLICRCVYHSGA
jgi:hypothetical protein